ncbi:molybdenum-pterin binding domain-containing protein [Sporobacter termitidis DSM 10068]|uniref:Molybdenum-pterin binding domain-containing protein n=1 Tax=Sporobacter termitidis DSM 10068 TaxID=1123282 RepID=A0A1M5UUK9_9FIRM|nr:helix-turn-helix domain-containing protein [Sporobacter termitidis]SHH66661.1 molybdenum-pterin binding domain-containing protein [Sporobacter termitidis DSM 10068]
MQEELLYTPEEIAGKLKLSRYTIYEMIKHGDIQAHRIGRSIRISESQLELYLLSTKQADNIFEADIVIEGDSKYALVNTVKIFVATDLDGRVRLMIRPEDIILSAGTFISSARNMLRGTVTQIDADDMSAKVYLNVGIPLCALITKRSLVEMDIKTGDELYAIFKTMSVRIVK